MAETLQERVLAYVRRHDLLRAGERVGVAVSGGADSVALLRMLLELRAGLGVVLSVVHFNHKIRGAEADADEQFVRELAERHQLEFRCSSGDAPSLAAESKLSLETAARELRYQYFRESLESGEIDKLATGHTRDDQAETVLMRLVRGAWTEGLAGVYPKVEMCSPTLARCAREGGASDTEGAAPGPAIVRPLLEVEHSELEAYLRSLDQAWCEDTTNRHLQHTRNRVRHVLLPLLEREFNPAVRQVLANAAEIARGEEQYWDEVVEEAGKRVGVPAGEDECRLSIEELRKLPRALQRRLLRAVGEGLGLKLGFDHIEQVVNLAAAAGGQVELPGGWVAENKALPRTQESAPVRRELVIRRAVAPARDYEYALCIPGAVQVAELGLVLRARVIPRSEAATPGYNRKILLDPELLGAQVQVRNWRAGDRYWPGHSKSASKVKELLQQRHISGLQRTLWPVAVKGGQLVWMRGFEAPREFIARGHKGVLIEEEPLAGDSGVTR